MTRIPSADVRPTMAIPAISTRHGSPGLEFLHWGYQKDAGRGPIPNARDDKLTGWWWKTFAQGRCLIAADGWYEWVDVPGAPKGANARKAAGLAANGKQRLFYEFDRSPAFFLAGLYGEGLMKDHRGQVETGLAAVVITTSACQQIAQSGHDRQPVVIPMDAAEEWLNGDDYSLIKSEEYRDLQITPVSGPVRDSLRL